MKEFLARLISAPSVKGMSETNAPFGADIRKALDVFLSEAEKMGLKTFDCDGYYGWAEYGDGESMIAIACHIDVVPATGNWDYPPFALTEKDGVYYGRGVADDKGAIAIALKLLGELKSSDTKLTHRIRVIVGCDEESGSECMEKYNAVDEPPAFAIVPDADFPVVNSEKGILHVTLAVPIGKLDNEIIEIYGGERPNIVCDKVYAKIKKDGVIGTYITQNGVKNTSNCRKISDTLAKFSVNPKDITLEENEDCYLISCVGIASHAMCPKNGDNAIFKLVSFLYAFANDVDLGALVCLREKICSKDIAKKLCIDCADDESGELTVNLGMIRFDGKNFTLTFDSRIPLCAKPDRVKDALISALDGKTVSSTYSPNLYIPKHSPQIQALLASYEEVVGEKGYCIKTGGGTYARSLPNAVAFGPAFEGFETDIHNANEKIRVCDLDKAYNIYKNAILKLDKIII
ncbi:MAG: Sapep family Mn(2+)-dependent dipeptidase [Clostridia bacterium]|nr:Sapep family Mn(2+)-dependent dipeptidase [Clostridia bacterium]